MYKKLSNSNKMDCADQLKNLAEKDTDFDVKFYASKTLSETFRDMLWVNLSISIFNIHFIL